MRDTSSDTDFALDIQHGYVSKQVGARKVANPQLILNNDQGSMLRALREELSTASEFTWSVAFVSPRAVALLKQELVDFTARGGKGTIVTSDYLGFNSPGAFRELLGLSRLGIPTRIYRQSDFHPKGYIFRQGELTTAIVGSSNLTERALVTNHEWNIRVTSAWESDLTDQLNTLVDEQVTDSGLLSEQWITAYAENYVAPQSRTVPRPEPTPLETAIGASPAYATFTIQPNRMQVEALRRISELRDSGAKRSLVVSATGTGKTILSALDVRAVQPQRLLFVVHREQIIDKAIDEFMKVLGEPRESFGKLVGGHRELDRKYVFASIQTLSKEETLRGIAPDAFDYMLVDEVHRSGASSYRKVLDHFTPDFLLGMTATPERTDGFNVFELFDYNVPYEIRLNEALDADMLSPFHYYGVTDLEFADGTTTDDFTTVQKLASDERVDHIIRALETYGHRDIAPKGLMFCSGLAEAAELSEALNQRSVDRRRLRTIALGGDSSLVERESAVARLENGELDYILTVDIFNEGVDIPSVNQIVMLRQTASSIVFVQQLGRGLRKSDGKEHLVVIDVIGNYTNNFLIPVALFGDASLNRESVRQKLISAEEVGVIAGLSSVRFDEISRDRVLKSIATTKLDDLRRIRTAMEQMRNRVGKLPALYDFYRFDSADPVILATKAEHYPNLLNKVFKAGLSFSEAESKYLQFLSNEVLPAKRLHDLVLLRLLLAGETLTSDQVAERFEEQEIDSSPASVASAINVLALGFNSTDAELKKYGQGVAVVEPEGSVRLNESFRRSYDTTSAFKTAVDDLIFTGLELIEARYDTDRPFTEGKFYGRKDACRSLLWPKNVQATIYGYKVHRTTQTCPIFVTLHKAEDVSASTAYEDALLDPSTMLWFTRSRRTLQSDEVRAITSNSVDLHVFAKKDDAEGSDFYYLGQAHAVSPEQTTMGDDLSVVKMQLKFEKPLSAAIFDYFQPELT
ncbi:DEAD/DEAH box helicase [Agrococcus casei]|uniref:DNA/RNA helicase of DEAD/DEAH box family n=1 Tax=Agrococcus casei LMG 22410 TaxID=1255656 RepID=A0A1R4G0G5_9MICO|nr:DEAD/DEAH box helicase [Agrococcus casei]SJM61648.1 DNA/RNA helicase of DEAD/DEAH box family [Agrococcus casei LMG 22410]